MPKQSHRASIIEVVSGTVFGLGVAVVANILILPLFGYNVTTIHAFDIGVVFTLISIIRGWIFRRVFEILRTTGVLP